MPTWVTILLAAVGGGVVLLLVLLVVLKVVLKRFLGKLLAAATGGAPPVRIKSVPKPADQPWHHEKAVSDLRKYFETEHSFKWVADMALEPMDGISCSMLVSKDGAAAVVYDHKKLGVWVDLVLAHGERGGLTVSSTTMGGMLEPPPFSQKHYLPGAAPAELWKVFREKSGAIPEADRRPLTRDNIACRFEEAYADEMDWCNAQGGPSLAEVRRIAEKTPKVKATDEHIENTRLIHKAMASAGLHEGLQERFKEAMTAEQKMRFRVDDLVLVHDRLTPEDLVGFVSSCVEDEEYEVTALPDACQGLTSLEAFEKLQDLLPEVVRFEKVASLEFPLTTHAYRPPNGAIPIEMFPHKHRPTEEPDDC